MMKQSEFDAQQKGQAVTARESYFGVLAMLVPPVVVGVLAHLTGVWLLVPFIYPAFFVGPWLMGRAKPKA